MFERLFSWLKDVPLSKFLDSPVKRWLWNNALLIRLVRRYYRQEFSYEKIPFEMIPKPVPGLKKGRFILTGENWLDEVERPIAVLWGFNSWKRLSTSEYLPEYRVAFAKRAVLWPFMFFSISKLARDNNGLVFIVWSYKEKLRVRAFSRIFSIPIYRMEDGFIRSASLGAQHTTPMSLCLDKTGLYLDATRPSDLENLLNTFDFDSETELLDKTRSIMHIMRDLKISKYKFYGLASVLDIIGLRTNKKRVLVIGQVEQDASIKFGLAKNWTNELLIRLASDENPNAEIYYRPHPDEMYGFRRNRRLRKFKGITILDQKDITVTDIFEHVDHVYTVTSLSGFEALAYGLKVTVVGAPFYAGWGVTDDRCQIPRRGRLLTVEQLYCAAYLLYPRYISNIGDSLVGILGAIFTVVTDAEDVLNQKLQTLLDDNSKLNKSQIKLVASSEKWPALLNKPILNSCFNSCGNLNKIFMSNKLYSIFHADGCMYRKYIAVGMIGLLWAQSETSDFLTIRDKVPEDALRIALNRLMAATKDPSLLAHCIWLSSYLEDMEGVSTLLHIQRVYNTKEIEAENGVTDATQQEKINYSFYASAIEAFMEGRSFAEAEELITQALLDGVFNTSILIHLANLAKHRFDFASSSGFWQLARNLGFDESRTKEKVDAELVYSSLVNGKIDQALFYYCRQIKKPQTYQSLTLSIVPSLVKHYGNLPFTSAGIEAAATGTSPGSLYNRIFGYIMVDDLARAERLLMTTDLSKRHPANYLFLLSQCYSFQGRSDEAKAIWVDNIDSYPDKKLYNEAIRVAVMVGDYDWGAQIIAKAESLNIEISDVNQRKIFLGYRQIKKSYETFRTNKASKNLLAYLKGKYVQDISEVNKRRGQALILACYGPGDEIRFASFYFKYVSILTDCSTKISCDPRLEQMLKRSFPDTSFISVSRNRTLIPETDFSKYDQIGGFDLHTFFDNNGWNEAMSSTSVSLATDFLCDVIKGYESFTGQSYLKPDPTKIEVMNERLAGYKKPLVGISWRSSLATYSRDEHYLAIDDLMNVLAIPDVQFINLQYDDCRDELIRVEKLYPGHLVNFEDIDQYNDFESVAALMSCMDLIISPATTVIELAGALGCPSWMLSNSSELHWRKNPLTGRDVWHSSVQHIEGDVLGDKASLTQVLSEKLNQWIKQCPM